MQESQQKVTKVISLAQNSIKSVEMYQVPLNDLSHQMKKHCKFLITYQSEKGAVPPVMGQNAVLI